MRCGGGRNHRIGLYDAVLIKDNHLPGCWPTAVADPIAEAIAAPAPARRRATVVEVEVDTLEQLDAALRCGPDIVLVDNLGPEALREAVRRRDRVGAGGRAGSLGRRDPGDDRRRLARTGVDRISVGALTHSALGARHRPGPDIDPDEHERRIVPSTSDAPRPASTSRCSTGCWTALGLRRDRPSSPRPTGAPGRLADDLDALEAFGFQIERHPYLGAAYRGPVVPALPRPDRARAGHAADRPADRRLEPGGQHQRRRRPGRGSTTANDGLVVLAEEQTTGRGQRGRIWTAPPRS